MPIKGLQAGPAFRPIGALRKGSEKRDGKWGEDLDHFRFTSDDEKTEERFYRLFGLEPRELVVYMPASKADDCFEFWREEYGAGALKHRCDGEHCILLWDPEQGEYLRDRSMTKYPCPGGCVPEGRLHVIIPELMRGRTVTVLTHSINDILNIQADLKQAELMLGGSLIGVPFRLSREEQSVSTPRFDKETGRHYRVRDDKWLVFIEIHPDYMEQLLLQMWETRSPELADVGRRLLAVDLEAGEDDVVEGEAEIVDDEMSDAEQVQAARRQSLLQLVNERLRQYAEAGYGDGEPFASVDEMRDAMRQKVGDLTWSWPSIDDKNLWQWRDNVVRTRLPKGAPPALHGEEREGI